MKTLALGVILGLVLLQAANAADATWLTDLAKAKTQAKEQNKMVLMDFTGSDWCPPCKALHENVLTNPVFEKYAKEHLVLLLVDFPHHKDLPAEQAKANEGLAREFDIQGFPTVIVLDSKGSKISEKVGYGGTSAEAFVADLQKLKSK